MRGRIGTREGCQTEVEDSATEGDRGEDDGEVNEAVIQGERVGGEGVERPNDTCGEEREKSGVSSQNFVSRAGRQLTGRRARSEQDISWAKA